MSSRDKNSTQPAPVASRYMLTAIGDGCRQVDAGWAYSDDPTRGEPLYAAPLSPQVVTGPTLEDAHKACAMIRDAAMEPDTYSAAYRQCGQDCMNAVWELIVKRNAEQPPHTAAPRLLDAAPVKTPAELAEEWKDWIPYPDSSQAEWDRYNLACAFAASATLATEKGLTPTGQHISDCERDSRRYRWLLERWLADTDEDLERHTAAMNHPDGPDAGIDAAMAATAASPA